MSLPISPARVLAVPANRLRYCLVLILAFVLVLTPSALQSSVADAQTTKIASDAFARSTSNGWGALDVGGTYTHVGARSFSTSAGVGKVALERGGQLRKATLDDVWFADGSVDVTFVMESLPSTGAGTYNSVVVRGNGHDHYRAVVRVMPTGQALLAITRSNEGVDTVLSKPVILAPTIVKGQRLDVRVSVSGTNPVTVQAKAWPDGTAEPDWLVTATDSSADRIQKAGSPQLVFYSSGSGGASTILVDDLAVSAASEASPPETTPGSPGTPSSAIGTTGALPIGQASYPVPTGAVFVATNGQDSSPGTQSAPLRTVDEALSRISSGGTIVIRGGSYNERFTISKTVTIQNYPGEAVWFDGSQVVSGWVKSGSVWRKDGWKYEFDSSPTFTFGAKDGTTANWGFVNPDYPMAAHPDQVWIAGGSLAQVKTLSQVGPGKFYVDYAADKLYVGSDPTGKDVRASTLDRAIEVRAAGVTIRGVGIRRFAPSVPHMGTITLERPNATLQNVHITDNSVTGLAIIENGATIDRVTVRRNGMLGVLGTNADGAEFSNVLAEKNNVENFNYAPAASGVKIGRTRGVSFINSSFIDNNATGLWLDESVYDVKVIRSVSSGNTRHGMSFEISALVTVAGSLIAENGGFGLKVNNTSQVSIWNNTLVDNDRPINLVQDERRGNQKGTPGHNPKRPFPDPTMPWRILDVKVHNNIISGTTGNCLLCVEDYSSEHTAEQMRVTSNNNVYQRDSASRPTWVSIWSRGKANPAVYTSVAAFKQGTGQEAVHLALDGKEALSADYKMTAAVRDAIPSVAYALPGSVAQMLGVATGVRHLGAWN